MVCNNIMCHNCNDGICNDGITKCKSKQVYNMLNAMIRTGNFGTKHDKLGLRAWVSDIILDWNEFKRDVREMDG